MKITWFATGDDTNNISSMNSNTLHACKVHLNKNHAMSTKKGILLCSAVLGSTVPFTKKQPHLSFSSLSLSLALAAIGCRDTNSTKLFLLERKL